MDINIFLDFLFILDVVPVSNKKSRFVTRLKIL